MSRTHTKIVSRVDACPICRSFGDKRLTDLTYHDDDLDADVCALCGNFLAQQVAFYLGDPMGEVREPKDFELWKLNQVETRKLEGGVV